MFNNAMRVEDDDVIMMLCKINLKKTNFTQNLICCGNGYEAFNFLKTEIERIIPDLIFLDINMPVMNGWEFLTEFKKYISEKFPSIVIKILSSSLDPRDINKAKSFNIVYEFISKPLNKDILISLLEINQ